MKWIADRAESILSDDHARGGFVEAELALDEDGKFLGLHPYQGADRRLLHHRPQCRLRHQRPWRARRGHGIPNVHAQVTGVLTNMMSNAQYRGGAKPEPVHVLEVMVDIAARRQHGPKSEYAGATRCRRRLL